VFQPASLRDETAQQQLAALNADVMVVVAYGLILPRAVLHAPRLGCLNVHASLLPRWRGAAPIQRAIEAGDSNTGITIMQMDVGLDTGAMLATATCPISAQMDAGQLHDALAEVGPPLLLKVLASLEHYQCGAQAQDDALATYAHKISKAEAELDWRCSATELDRRVRAFNPFPVCYSVLNGERIRVWQASEAVGPGTETLPGTILKADDTGIAVSTGQGALRIEVLQLEGGRALPAKQLLSAHRDKFAPAQRFDVPAPSGD
jgi:methionyl-tRNA formyltransferase